MLYSSTNLRYRVPDHTDHVLHSSDKPSVIVGISLSTSPASLSLASSESFCIVVHARILSTPHPEKSVTLRTDPSPLDGLSNRSFHNISCVQDQSKRIEIWPIGWDFPRGIDTDNLQHHFPFITIPPKDQGIYSVRHKIPLTKIKAAGLQKGERYAVSLTDKCLGTRWWTFGSLEELEGIRFVQWHAQADTDSEREFNPELVMGEERERKQRHGDTIGTMGEQPSMLAMVPELREVEFEVD